MENKICTTCKEEKELSCFYKSKHQSQGRGSHCKPCTSIKRKNRYEEHSERILKENAIYQEEHKAEILAQKKEKYKNNKATEQIRMAALRDKHKTEKVAVYCLPNYNQDGFQKYAGVSNRLHLRMLEHGLNGKDTSGYFVIAWYDTRAEALAKEATLHELGYAGRNPLYEKQKTTI